MSRWRLMVQGQLTTLLAAQQARDAAIMELPFMNQHMTITAYTDDQDGGHNIVMDVQLPTLAEMDTLKTVILAYLRHPLVRPTIGRMKVSWHRCTHDEPVPQNCQTTDYEEITV